MVLRITKIKIENILLFLMLFFILGFKPITEKEQNLKYVLRLEQDIKNVNDTIKVTKILIKKSKGTPYIPDVIFRLAELYVEKSRLTYYLHLEKNKDHTSKIVFSNEVKLLKDLAITTYKQIIHNYPLYKNSDKALFFMAHEYKELGYHKEMITTYNQLIDKFNNSQYTFESILIIGDYYFDKSQLNEAEKHYKKIIYNKNSININSAILNMAYYKLAWCHINHEDFKGAFNLFEKIVTSNSTNKEHITLDTHKDINLKKEALIDMVFCYTEVGKPEDAVKYFKQHSYSKQIYTKVLEKLANRYFLKEKYQSSAQIYKEILGIISDEDKKIDYAQRIYESYKRLNYKNIKWEDIKQIIIAAKQNYFSWKVTDKDRKDIYKSFELMTRDLITNMHKQSKNSDNKLILNDVIKAYKHYLTFYEYSGNSKDMKFNYADALYENESYYEAGRQYEYLLKSIDNNKKKQDILYLGIISYYKAFYNSIKDKKTLNILEKTVSQEGMVSLGNQYISQFPKSDKIPKIKFNIARMYYDQGKYSKSISHFIEFINKYPQNSETEIAGHLVLDCYNTLEDYESLIKQGEKFIANKSITNSKFKNDLKNIISKAEKRQIGHITLSVSESGGDVSEQLVDFASKHKKSKIGEKAIYSVFIIAKEKNDINKMIEMSNELSLNYKNSKYLKDVYQTLAHIYLIGAEYEKTANLYEKYTSKFPKDKDSNKFLLAASNIRAFLGDYDKALKNLENILKLNKLSKKRKKEIYKTICTIIEKKNDYNLMLKYADIMSNEKINSKLAQFYIAYAQFLQGKFQKSKKNLLKFIKKASKKSKRANINSSDIKNKVIFSSYLLAEISMKKYYDIKYYLSKSDISKVIEEKYAEMEKTEKLYNKVIKLTKGKLAIASIYKIGLIYQEFTNFLISSPLPNELNKLELEEYKDMITKKQRYFKNKSDSVFNICNSNAKKANIFNKYRLGCIDKKQIEETYLAYSMNKSVTAYNISQEISLKDSLLKKQNDTTTLKELSRVYIRAGEYNRAKMVLSKVFEIKEDDVEAHNLLGVAYYNNNEYQEAFYEFKNLLKRKRLKTAKLNLAALYYKFDDKKNSNKILKNISKLKNIDFNKTDILPLVEECIKKK